MSDCMKFARCSKRIDRHLKWMGVPLRFSQRGAHSVLAFRLATTVEYREDNTANSIESLLDCCLQWRVCPLLSGTSERANRRCIALRRGRRQVIKKYLGTWSCITFGQIRACVSYLYIHVHHDSNCDNSTSRSISHSSKKIEIKILTVACATMNR